MLAFNSTMACAQSTAACLLHAFVQGVKWCEAGRLQATWLRSHCRAQTSRHDLVVGSRCL